MVRILHILNELSNGGNVHFIMNYYRYIDRSKVQFDFLISTAEKGYFEDEIISLGGKVYHVCSKKHLFKNFYETKKIVKLNGYDIVHRHTGSAFGYFDLRAAKRGGAKNLILHAHSSGAGNLLLHKISKIFFKTKCRRFACSDEAGIFLFGKKDFQVWKNAIDCEKFSFSNEKRKLKRRELELKDEFVIGHVGCFEKVKNHIRLIQIFQKILEMKPNSVLVCVGIGSQIDNIKEQVKTLGISDKVRFLYARDDVSQLMSAFDIFVLPSLYEGLPLVVLEAQSSGLPCVLSNTVSNLAKITEDVSFCPLASDNQKWGKEILRYEKGIRKDTYGLLKQAGYDIVDQAIKLEQFYVGLKDCKEKNREKTVK